MSLCRSCQRPVKWVVIASSGARMPLDVQPTREKGNIKLLATIDPETGSPLAQVLTGFELMEVSPAVALYVSHFSTCPHADDHRRRTVRRR